MDLYLLLVIVISAGVIVAVVLISKKYGYKLPLILGILAILVSIYFIFTQPKPSTIYEEPVVNAMNQMGIYLGLIFAVVFFITSFYLYRASKATKEKT
jgi:H+/gluconate symporter-like permease